MMSGFHSSIVIVQILMSSCLLTVNEVNATAFGLMLGHVVFRIEHKSTTDALIWAARKGSDLACGHVAS